MGISFGDVLGEIGTFIPGSGLVEAAIQGRSVKAEDFTGSLSKYVPGGKSVNKLLEGRPKDVSWSDVFLPDIPFVGDTNQPFNKPFDRFLNASVDTGEIVGQAGIDVVDGASEGMVDVAQFGADLLTGRNRYGTFNRFNNPLDGYPYMGYPQMMPNYPPQQQSSGFDEETKLMMLGLGGMALLVLLLPKDKKP